MSLDFMINSREVNNLETWFFPRIYTLTISFLAIFTIMNFCVHCDTALQADVQFYHLLDTSPEVVSIAEQWIDREVSDGDCLCQDCFILIINNLDVENRVDPPIDHRSQMCVCCGISIARRSGRRSRLIPEDRPERAYIINLIHPRQMPADARVCNACWLRAHRNSQQQNIEIENDVQNEQIPEIQEEDRNEEIILNEYSRTPDTPNHCFVPECRAAERLRVPIYIKRHLLENYKLYVTRNCRVCAEHAGTYNWEFMEQYEFISHSFNAIQVQEMLQLLSRRQETLSFENVENMNENLCRYWTGLTVVKFITLLNCVQQLFEVCKKPKTALGLFLIKLRTGDSFERIASIFCLSASTVSMSVKKVRQCLAEFYVPQHLGTSHISRESLSERNLIIPQGLFGTEERNPIVICDGTYIYMQKSSNYLFQKKSYSLHKYRNLVKPFMMVATDGHIIDVLGPYAANKSDADIMRDLFQPGDSELRSYFRENDIFILDRGFRDAINLLTSLGYSVYKPESLEPGETQLSTTKANESRLVTMCRWVVEIVNGRFKRDYKIFRTEYFNRMAKTIKDNFRIAAAIINHFHPVVTDRSDAQSILNRALLRQNLPNHLAEHVIGHQLNRRRANFLRIDAEIPELNMFPIMEMSDLILFALGTYQIKQARSYYGEHIRMNGTFEVEVSNEINTANVPGISSHEPLMIRGRIRSRYRANIIYYTYILIDTAMENWQQSICGYYCTCIIGKRTVGSCAHVMTMVWYLGWARHRDDIVPPALFLDGVLVREDIENE